MDATQLRERGRALVLAGEKLQARALLEQSLELNRYDADTWAWLAAASEDRPRQIAALRQSLTLAPRQVAALVVAEHVGISPEELGVTVPTHRQPARAADIAAPSPAAPPDPTAWMAAPVPVAAPPRRVWLWVVRGIIVLLLGLIVWAVLIGFVFFSCGCTPAGPPVAVWPAIANVLSGAVDGRSSPR